MVTAEFLVVMSHELLGALQTSNTKELDRLLQTVSSVNSRDIRGVTPLYWASGYGNPKTVSYLIYRGADVNYVTSWHSYPLHAAADAGHVTIVKILISSGAEINCIDSNGDTPTHLASMKDLKSVTEVLLANGADRTVRNKKGRTPMEEAILCHSRECVSVLMEKPSSTNRTVEGDLVETSPRKLMELTLTCGKCNNCISLRRISMSNRDLIDRRSVSGGYITRAKYIGSTLSETVTKPTLGGVVSAEAKVDLSAPVMETNEQSSISSRLALADQSNIKNFTDRSHLRANECDNISRKQSYEAVNKSNTQTEEVGCLCRRESSAKSTSSSGSSSSAGSNSCLKNFTKLKTNYDNRGDLLSLIDALQLEVVKEREQNEQLEMNSSRDKSLLTQLNSDLSLERARSRYLSDQLATYFSSSKT